MIISLIGSADAGKTTIINRLLENETEIFGNKKVIYKGDGDIFLINLFKKFFGEQKTKSFNTERQSSTANVTPKKSTLSYIYEILYFLAVVLDYAYDYIKYEIFFRKKVLIKDRYIYDFYVTFKVNLNINNSLVLWIIEHFPKPTLIFFISVTDENLFKRNKNNISGLMTSQKDFFSNVVNEYTRLVKRKKILIIDNNEDIYISVGRISSTITKYIRVSSTGSIIISGPDGAGKSTLIKNLSNKLLDVGIDNYVVHFYHDTLLYKFLKLLGIYKTESNKLLEFKKNLEQSKRNEGKNKPYWWGLLNIVDAYTQIFISKMLNPKKVIIYDRYLYDFLVSFEYYKVPRYRELLGHIKMQPNAFIIISEPKILYERKPENLYSYFEFAYNKYLELAEKFEMKVIDTTHTNEKEAISKVWSEI